MSDTKILLPESDIPTHWYNVIPDLPGPLAPYVGPDGQPVPPEAMTAIFPPAIVEQEVSTERWIAIPEPVREALRLWRPSPLIRATRLEEALGTPAKIFFKYEGVSPAGSHKPNSAVAQAYYNREAGITRLTTETGAGQWGSSLALAGSLFGLDVRVYMVRVSYEQKPHRRSMMQTWGGEVIPSPSPLTETGRKALADDPDNPGSLGLAISEAVEEAAGREDTNYALGSVLNHVLLHQTVIGQETKRQLEIAGAYPDVILAPCGGGSNVGGMMFPFLADKAAGRDLRLVAVEPDSCPTLTRGHYAYDYGDSAGLTPIMKMYTLGHDFMPPGIHAGGLRYHGDSALVSQLYDAGVLEAVAVPQLATFEAGVLFARTQGIIPAPESCHAVRGAVDEALRAKEEGRERTILFTLSGHGHFDMASYDRYFAGELENYEYPEAAIHRALDNLPQIGG
ncbi:Tryptophan synthase beta chain [wastewater metagenome]|uniref:tryptophan synthase n=3 Tax=root TaxID=1 RepID=A0A5B8RBE0_9ZZZZ|nr:TrpB-like pyridoxal phosphate-dependent enzyme [Arhodomonas aquaeolei]MCS4505327.1 TrpB-like pyridoxal phosphate-dependent enzyme [Arhodomonas aquaeolei]QEA06016.1 tryptophan synthase beta chain [uncultured organism]